MTGGKRDIQRIHVDKQGYDSTGAYWGAGPDVFIATSEDGNDEIAVRARNLTEARARVAAELARKPGAAAPETRVPLGGHATRKTRYEIDWLNPLTNASVRIRITHARDYLATGSDHIEVESIKPGKAPLPITETGYRSHFMPALDLINAGGPVTFVQAWIEQAAKGKAWTKATTAKPASAPAAQGDLFQWAAARSEVGKRRTARPARPATRAQKIAGKGRDPA